jgi:ParB family transcriptional regulator, chromosome partitioning protein
MMNIQNKKISELIPYENNPRINDKAVEYVKNSIAEFGFKVPIVIDKNNVIVCGHTRWKASKELGLKEVPCIIADDLSDEQIKAFRLADNKVSEIAEWDLELLDNELSEIDLDMEQFGFELSDDEPLFEEEENEEKEVNKKILKCPVCGHINEEKAFKYYEDT